MRHSVSPSWCWVRSTGCCRNATTVKQRIALAQVAEGVIGNLGQIEQPVEGQLVEGFDVFQSLADAKSRQLDQTVAEGIKDEGVVGAG